MASWTRRTSTKTRPACCTSSRAASRAASGQARGGPGGPPGGALLLHAEVGWTLLPPAPRGP
eukprot:9514346-Alexandrium_andersonii.AAC.1